MKNATIKVNGNMLTISIDLSKTVDKSERGNDIVAVTDRFETVAKTQADEYGLKMIVTKRAIKKAASLLAQPINKPAQKAAPAPVTELDLGLAILKK